ncbi:hypothetical protein [Methylobacterium sp. NEAU K]|uniref:hypothetical protein n=1 Tax=Methylobacterium sp. NEAU K TaxID=3064946 RepID=UPI002734C467|nr:hypothetical protein [Methylobacterium sp. NEAU K]MDP4005122.1 hypothetical protein [Methylobacterium sp. NEAU K]
MAESRTITREGFTAADLADCAEREVRQRQRAYPRWVEAGRMTQQHADRQTALMRAIARKLRAEADAEGAKGDLFGIEEVRRGF